MSIERTIEANSPEDNDDIEIEVIDPTPEEDKGRKALPPETDDETEARAKEMDSYSDRVQKRIGELTHRLNDERRAKEQALREKEEADQFAQRTYEENHRLQQTLGNGYGVYVNEFASRLNAAQELAEITYKQAYESGDTEKMVAAQRAFSDIAVQRSKLDNMSSPVPQQEPQYAPQNQVLTNYQEPAYSPPTPSYEPEPDFVDPRTEEWHLRNPWFGKEQDMTSLALGVHGKLVEQGHSPSSPEYFAAIDREMQVRFPEKFGKPRKSSPVAPAGRVSATKKVTLTQSEVDRANKYNIPLERYAREKAKLMESN